jgi:hypothetical protein
MTPSRRVFRLKKLARFFVINRPSKTLNGMVNDEWYGSSSNKVTMLS